MQEGKKKEYTYQVMYVCIYYAINLLQKMLCTKYYPLHINGNHSILGMVEKKYLYLQVLPQYKKCSNL